MPRITAAAAGGANLCAFLDMIAWSEGTDNGRQSTRDHGYDVLVGGGLFSSYAGHPRKLITLPALGIRSTAAGCYQLLARYWDHYRQQPGLRDFGPISQDRVALQQIKELGALGDIQAGESR
jgi:muramidase (phage lysozyme)